MGKATMFHLSHKLISGQHKGSKKFLNGKIFVKIFEWKNFRKNLWEKLAFWIFLVIRACAHDRVRTRAHGRT